MGAPAFMLSILHRQRLLLRDEFVTRYPSEWLVWEPGPWKPARSVLESNLESTQQPASLPPLRPAGDDVICFQLQRGATLKVGRATSNDIVVNDLTASREQFQLRFEAGAWVLDAPVGVVVNEHAVEGAVPLAPGAAIVLGGVRMTLLSAADMAKRAADFRARQS
jgi:hypothetical protein